MGSFKYYREKKQRDQAILSHSEKTYVDKLVTIADQYMNVNKDLDIYGIVETAYQQILNEEMLEIDKQLKNAILYAIDRLKEKYPPRLNTDINDGDCNDDNSRNVKRPSK